MDNAAFRRFAHRTFTSRSGTVVLAPTFQHAALRPGAALQLEVTAPNRVGKVETFVIRSGQGPIVTKQCLPPGVKRPTRCVKKP